MILVRNQTPAKEWINEDRDEKEQTRNDIQWVIIQKNEKKIAIGAVYIKCNTPKFETENTKRMTQLQEDIIQLKTQECEIMILGDFNAHIKEMEKDSQGNPHHVTNKNGHRLQKLARTEDLAIMNNNNKTKGQWTWMRKTQKSVIDYILTSQKLEKRTREMIIDDKGEILAIKHDHQWMEITLNIEKEESQMERKQERWNIKANTNWPKFRENMKEAINEYKKEVHSENDDILDTLLKYEKIMETIRTVGQQEIGMITPKQFKIENRPPRKVRNRIKKRNKTVKEWKKACKLNQGDTKWKEMKKAVKRAKKAIRKDNKRKAGKWIQKNYGHTKNIWMKLRQQQKIKEIEVTWIGNKESTNMQDIKNYITEYWKEMGKGNKEDNDMRGKNSPLDKELGKEIKEKEYVKAKMELKNGKTTGWDNIPNEFLKYGGEELDNELRKLFQEMIDEEKIPKDWKDDKLKMIYKKGDSNRCENYRGIAISSNVFKLYSRIINRRVMKYVEENKILSEMQNAFRETRSMADNIMMLQAIMNKNCANHNETYLCFIDLEKAYDKIPRKLLWTEMEKQGIGGKFLRIIKEMYNGQRRKVKTKSGWTDWIESNMGLRQGCVFSPLLFTIYMNNIHEELGKAGGIQMEEVKIPALLFADDLLLIAKGEQEMKNMITGVEKKLTEKEQKISFPKSKTVRINRAENKQGMWVIKDENGNVKGVIEESEETKYLGITLNGKDQFRSHKKIKIEDAKRLLGIMKWKVKQTPNRFWATNEMWKQSTRTNLLYGMEAIPTDGEFTKEISNTQTKAAKFGLQCSKYASAEAARGEMGWRTIKQEIRRKKLKYWAKIRKLPNERWLKQTLNWTTKNPNKSDWMREVKRGLREINWSKKEEDDIENSIKNMNKKLKITEQGEWEEKMREEKEKHYPKKLWNKTAKYLLKGRKETIGLKELRLRDLEKAGEKRSTQCKKCGEERKNITQHILTECSEIEDKRKEYGIEQRMKKNKDRGDGITKGIHEILDDSGEKNLEILNRIVKSWKELPDKE